MPTRASRLGALNRGRPGRFRHSVSATAPSGCWTNRRNRFRRGVRDRQRAEVVHGDLPDRGQEGSPPGRVDAPEIGLREVVVDRHREEELTLGVGDDRLVPAEQVDIALAHQPPVARSDSSGGRRMIPNVSLTGRWFR